MKEHTYHDVSANTIFGFWIYLMTDLTLFAILFATYAVFHSATYGGPTSHDLFNPSYALIETLTLLLSSFTCSMAMLAIPKASKPKLFFWYALTFILGLLFLRMMLSEFSHLVQEGNSWTRSAFLSSYFTLIGAHGVHIFFGLLFMIVFAIQTYQWGFIPVTIRRLTCLNIFWFFSYLVWIFMFTMVYLMGVI